MTTLQANQPLSFQSMLGYLPQLSAEELDELAWQARLTKARKHTPNLSQKETDLFQKIHSISVPKELRARCHKLTTKQRAEGLSEAEQQQLEDIVDEIEGLNVMRLTHLLELATIQKTDPEELIKRLGLAPLQYE